MNPGFEYGPPFPPSAQRLIMSYHRAHSNSLRLAQYIGPGSETLVPFLADYFQHINVSHTDTSSTREAMGNFQAANWWKAKCSFSTNEIEQSHRAVAKGSVDMCFLLAPEDWGDVDRVVEAVAESLAPNGTLCVLGWGRVPHVHVQGDGEPGMREHAVAGLFGAWWVAFQKKQSKEKRELYNSPLDFIPLRHEEGDAVWIQDVTKRIKINLRRDDEGNPIEDNFGMPAKDSSVVNSRVGPQQRRYCFDLEDVDGKGWSREVDKRWFQGLVRYWRDEHEVDLSEGEELRGIEETLASDQIVLEWRASILLATRK